MCVGIDLDLKYEVLSVESSKMSKLYLMKGHWRLYLSFMKKIFLPLADLDEQKVQHSNTIQHISMPFKLSNTIRHII